MIDLTVPGQMTRSELEALETLARKVPPHGMVVEIGSLYGRSSVTWATTVHPTVTVHCIDPWERDNWIIDLVESVFPDCPPFSFEAFQKFTRGLSNIQPIIGRSPDDVSDWSKSVDICFDDGMHHNPYFRDNLHFWLKHMKPRGIMCGHDYCAQWSDVMREVDGLAESLSIDVNVSGQVWWIQLPESLPSTHGRWFRRRH